MTKMRSSLAALAAITLIGAPAEVASANDRKDRTVRGTKLRVPNPWYSSDRRRAQWKDETNRRGRNR